MPTNYGITTVYDPDLMSLSEEDIKNRYITPAITNAKWEPNDIRFEYPITDGQIKFTGNKAVREKPKKADYVLFFNSY